MQKAKPFSNKSLSAISLMLSLLLSIIFQNCQKPLDPILSEQSAARKKPHPHDPPPPPPPFALNCAAATINGSFVVGVATNATITVPYNNSPGGSYPAYTSPTINGITLSAPAGTLNVGSGNIVYTASGVPVSPGQCLVQVGIGNAIGCYFVIIVLNAPPSGENCGDPGTAVGSTGCVTFVYRGQTVSYTTVRADDGKIWLQQNLGSPQVAFSEYDVASYGHYFQWGRWDDGHQPPNSPTIAGSSSLQNPSQIPGGNPNFIMSTTAATAWWSTGSSSDTWSGATPSSTNGIDPCSALGAGWRLPTAAEWQNIAVFEDLFGTIGAAQSNLKLPASGYRYAVDGGVIAYNADIGYYWTSTADNNGNAKVFFFDNNYNAGVVPAQRGNGFSCRCVKD